MDILTGQIALTVTIFFSMFFSCLLPLKFIFKGRGCELAISLANCFSAGVFVATFFIGLLPEVRDQFRNILYQHQIITQFPVTEFVVFWGFFLSFFIEQLIITCRKYSEEKINLELTEESSESDIHLQDLSASTDSRAHLHLHPHPHHHHHHDFDTAINPKSGVRIGFLLSSLGVHSLFEGMTLGLQTHLHDLVNLFIGVLVHECLIAFGVGISIAKAKLKLRTSLMLAVLISITIPIGQTVGIVVGNTQSITNDFIIALIQAVAAGTFIHVTFLEIIPEGLGEENWRLIKVFFLSLGFLLIAIIPTLIGIHDHHLENNQFVKVNYEYLLNLKSNSSQL